MLGNGWPHGLNEDDDLEQSVGLDDTMLNGGDIALTAGLGKADLLAGIREAPEQSLVVGPHPPTGS